MDMNQLAAIKQKTLDAANLRTDRTQGIRVVVGLATCGMAAGATPVLEAFKTEVQKQNVQDIVVAQTGCIGMCALEPIVEVYMPGKQKVTYVNITPDKVPQIVRQHIINNSPVMNLVIGAAHQ